MDFRLFYAAAQPSELIESIKYSSEDLTPMVNNSKIAQFLIPGRHVHLVGIGGVSMRPLGLVLKGMGMHVTGSDMSASAGTRELEKIATTLEESLREEGESRVIVGIGTMAAHLRDLAKSYKEAQIAIDVGKVFDTERYVINYETLGIGRLIYQLPTTLCEMFLLEVFKKNPIDSLDKETLFTINKFFENNLVLSETARKLFVHRNTLVYRLEKIKKLTGLDLREFDDAITFKVALMVKKYLASRGIEA
jgi:carbohydrate diacid regulator